jgi:hypothetical protein
MVSNVAEYQKVCEVLDYLRNGPNLIQGLARWRSSTSSMKMSGLPNRRF